MVKYLFITMVVIIFCLVGYIAYQNHKSSQQIMDLQNKIAETATTVKVTQDLYEKASIQSKNLSTLLDDSTTQNKELMAQINKQKGTILSLTSVVLTTAPVNGDVKLTAATQPSSGPSSKPSVFDFNQRIGRYTASGSVLVDAQELQLKIDQDPLKLNVAVYQNKDQSWHAAVQTDDPDVKADIKVSGVDPFILEQKWYEHISFGADLGYGQIGLLTGIKANYQVGQVEFGPDVWVLVNSKVSPIFGANVLWHPWQK